ncbi:MAG: hypothetical protein H6572_02280 [Lewinellaceae bacterium]|nr:hypothetical protein [Lewinellaceae bacterium]
MRLSIHGRVGFTSQGGCTVVESGKNVDAPSSCGGSITVNYTVSDQCGQSDACSATFTVGTAFELTAICPADGSIDACHTQVEVDAAFDLWKMGFTSQGGCTVEVSGLNVDAPSSCGGSITINYLVEDECGQSDNCSATFTVGSGSTLTAICPADGSIEACHTEDEVDAAFSDWLDGFTSQGGCTVVESGKDVAAPSSCGGSITVNYNVSDQCGQSDNCSATFTVGTNFNRYLPG